MNEYTWFIVAFIDFNTKTQNQSETVNANPIQAAEKMDRIYE